MTETEHLIDGERAFADGIRVFVGSKDEIKALARIAGALDIQVDDRLPPAASHPERIYSFFEVEPGDWQSLSGNEDPHAPLRTSHAQERRFRKVTLIDPQEIVGLGRRRWDAKAWVEVTQW